jgi:hypothetical protein
MGSGKMSHIIKQTAKFTISTAPWSARKIQTKDGRDFFMHRREPIYISMCTASRVDGIDLQYKQTETTGLLIQYHDAQTVIIYNYIRRG